MPQALIAIIGVAARLPGAEDLDAFWRLLVEGRHAITEVPQSRWSHARFGHPRRVPGRSYTFAAGVLDDVAGFDADFFGISPREAEQIDPQQRWLLEMAWRATEDAGLRASDLSNLDTGVYVASAGGEYGALRQGDPATADAYFMTGVTGSVAANRISYTFDLHGPSFTVDTACSSSLVALHLACEDLARGRTGAALVGGVNSLLSPYPYIGFSQASMLSPNGRCFAFDARADGYVRAEGAVVLLLKRLDDALTSGDPIRAVIRGTAVNSDGRTMGLSLPNPAAQAKLLRSVYAEAGVEPGELAFVEAHGTGTAAGDPIETAALGEVLGRSRTRPLPIGSVKTNVGHLEVASGMAGLLKAMLALDKRILPPSLNFETPNPNIDFEALNLTVASSALPLPSQARSAGINSFGFGGTNAHVILQAPPESPQEASDVSAPAPPLVVSARSAEALEALSQVWAERLLASPEHKIGALLRGSARRREQHPYRRIVWGEQASDLAAALAAPSPRRSDGRAVGGSMAFVFSGNGCQWMGMGRAAYRFNAAFRDGLAMVDAALEPHIGWSAVTRLLETEDEAEFHRTDVSQPLLLAIQIASVKALQAAGVRPTAVVGHSVGEIASAWCSGALDLDQACHVVAVRSQQQQRTADAGRMAALGLDVETARGVLSELDPELCIAAENASRSVTVAGPGAALAALRRRAKAEDWAYRDLSLNYAFHSAAMDPVREDLLAGLADLAPAAPVLPLFSSVTGERVVERDMDAAYWWRNIRQPVRFRPAISNLVAEGGRILLEVGPQPVLQSYLRDALRQADVDGRVLASLNQSTRDPAFDPFESIVGAAYTAGYDLEQSPLFRGKAEPRDLPAHPLRRDFYWTRATTEGVYPHHRIQHHALLGDRSEQNSGEWENILDLVSTPFLADHAVGGVGVLPGAAIVEMGLAAARFLYPEARAQEVIDLQIFAGLPLELGAARQTRFVVGEGGRFRLESRERLVEAGWSLNATGVLAACTATCVSPSTPDPDFTISAGEVYAAARSLGLQYGPAFQVVAGVDARACGAALVRLDLPSGEVEGGDVRIGVTALDGALQGFLALLCAGALRLAAGESLLPERFGRVRAFAAGLPASAAIQVERRGVRTVEGRVLLCDGQGRVLLEATGIVFRRVRLFQASVEDRIFHTALTPSPLGSPGSPQFELDVVLAAAEGAAFKNSDGAALLQAYLLSAVLAALQQMAGGTSLSADLLFVSGKLAPDALGLFNALASELVRNRLLSEVSSGFAPTDADGFGDSTDIWRTALDEAPELGLEAAVLAERIRGLPDRLAGAKTAAKLPPAVVEQMLYRSASGQVALGALCDAITALTAGWPAERPLRVLEFGAGGGGATHRLLRALAPLGEALSYTASDDSAEELDRLKAVVGGGPQVVVSPRQAVSGPFDLVISAYGGTLLGPATTTWALDQLAPGGAFLSVEPEPSLAWTLFRDGVAGRLEAEAEPRSGARWVDALKRRNLAEASAAVVRAPLWAYNLISGRSMAPAALAATAVSPGALVIAGASDPALSQALVQTGASVETVADPAELQVLDVADAAFILIADVSPPLSERLTETVAWITAIVESGFRGPVLVITRGAGEGDMEAAALRGAARTLVNETPELPLKLLDLDPGLDSKDAAAAILSELAAGDGEIEVSQTSSGRFVPRLRQGVALPIGKEHVLEVLQPGLLSSLTWSAPPARPAPAPGQVTIEVAAAGLNFRDVMWAQGLLPEAALQDGFAGPTLGLECAGRVSAVGADVKGLKPGDRVMAMAPASLASTVVTRADAAVVLPDQVSFEQAATIPVAFLTVLYSLDHLARLEAGERVLIHGAAGAVGLAAIRLAKSRGAEVYASAGSEFKRSFAEAFGADHLLDSRSLSFADEVMQLTHGEGVDVVLNSLNGEAMIRSLSLLRPFGRFVELGKRDYFEDTRVGLRPFRENIAYFGVDADRLLTDRPALAKRLLKQAADLLAEGALGPLPYRTFGREEVCDAFRLMQGGGHIGKIVIRLDDAAAGSASQPSPRSFSVNGEGVYVVTGGLTGFGLETARWLSEQGARRLALLGRRGPTTPDAQSVLAELRRGGLQVEAVSCDVADAGELARTLEAIRAQQGPIVGVIHAAAVIEDGLLASVTPQAFERVLRPKLDGARNLDALTRDDQLELFILFSSATTVLGAPGQGAYVAANSALEALAEARFRQGLPALAVGWGPIADVGMLARDKGVGDALARRLAVEPLTAREALNALPAMWSAGVPVVAQAAVRWGAARRMLRVLAGPKFEAIAGAGDGYEPEESLATRLSGLAPEQAQEVVASLLRGELAKILACAPERVELDRPLPELGMDSLMLVELRLVLEERLGVETPLLAISGATTLNALAVRVVRIALGSGSVSLLDVALRHEGSIVPNMQSIPGE
ncbi:type I polyketide synthase [Caulobacter sp. S45]|uniref:type I polyketide synthase n=1 Tax=Caulobacter sp. S45 TaxID=1641861 RepID=UPI00157671E2|nr:type I polyketide synthase [Caulobacter sp. S45]